MDISTQKQAKILWSIVWVLILGLVLWYGYGMMTRTDDDTNPYLVEISKGQFVDMTPEAVLLENLSQKVPNTTMGVEIENPADSEKKNIKTIDVLLDALTENPLAFNGWVELGGQYASLQLYDKAVEAYEFAGLLRPQSALPAGNLAFLYGYYIHDNEKAIEKYREAITIEPSSAYHYIRFFEFYRDIGDMTSARKIIVEGLSVLPEDQSLQSYSEL